MRELQGHYRVKINQDLSPKFKHLVLEAPDLASVIEPGQFVNIRVSAGTEPLLRRPFSVYRALNGEVELFYEVLGRGTKVLAQKKSGDVLDVLGPLGQPFSLPPSGTEHVVMIAGGIGVAPFQILTDALEAHEGLKLTLLYGARTFEHTFNMDDLERNRCRIMIATEDGSVGVKGRVSRLFSDISWDPNATWIYTCGPNAMMAAVQEFAREQNIRGEVSCESAMACGTGACLGCVVRTVNGYKTVCHDGPVFGLHEVIF